jgi:hypothetical protein
METVLPKLTSIRQGGSPVMHRSELWDLIDVNGSRDIETLDAINEQNK